MDGAALAPSKQVGYWRWLIVSVLLGAAGSMVAIAAFGEGTYTVGPLVMRLKVRPDTKGTTEFAINPITGLKTGYAEASTHSGFVAFRGTVIGVRGTVANTEQAVLALRDPKALAETIRDQGEDAFRRFGLRIGLLTLAGGASGGFAVALVGLKARRIFQGMIAGVVLVGALGLLAWQTYDIDEFSKVQFKPLQALSVSAD